MSKLRTSQQIIAEILKAAKNGAKKTRIKGSCNLTYNMTGRFLNYLLEAGLLAKWEENSFLTTEKGFQFLKIYQTLELLMNSKI